MNIIIDESTYNGLLENLLTTVEFGATMKGCSSTESDRDYLHIIEDSTTWLSAPVNTQHLLQFKSAEADHIFCTPSNFVKCLLHGDNTIFHEMLRFKALTGTCLEFLQNYEFNHYKTLRAYLGIARRDLREVTSYWKKDNRKSLKKLKFALESLNYVKHVRGFSESNILTVPELKDIHKVRQFVEDIANKVDHQRTQLNKDLDCGLIIATLSENDIQAIHTKIGCLGYASYDVGMEYFYKNHVQGL